MLQINKRWARALGALGLAAIVGLVAGCGGGGGSSSAVSTSGTTSSGSSTTSSGGSTTTTTATGGATGRSLIASAAVTSITGPLAANQVTVTVANGVAGAANIPTVSVKICVPGSAVACATISNVQIDTGSFGLRLTSEAVNAANATLLSALPNQTVGSLAVAECMGFADGNSWGSVRTADVTIGSEAAANMPIHILGDVAQSQAGGFNNACALGTLHDTSTGTTGIGANGILGIGTAKYDCGTGCQTTTINDIYYACTLTGGTGGTLSACTDSAVPLAQQVANPVQSFATDNNGVILNMPAVGATGAVKATGFLTFGLGTQSNNALPSSGIQTFQTDHFGDVKSATLDGTTYTDTSPTQRAAFFDTGSNGLFLPGSHSGLLLCTGGSGFYCPTSAVALQPSVTGFNGTTATLPISIENAFDLFNGNGLAFSNLGGTSGLLAVDFGLPFFYGKTVYVKYDTANSGSLNVGTVASVSF